MTDHAYPHLPVLLTPVLEALCPDGRAPQRIIDGTLGAGGHAWALLARGTGELLGLDLDPEALTIARARLSPFGARVHTVHTSYATMKTQASALGWDAVDAILLDLGVSSMQVDRPARGFSFIHDGPLDMRFDPSSDMLPAADLVNHWDERALADIFFRYGEERHARRIARIITGGRPFTTTRALADAVAAGVPREKRRDGKAIHPATRIFQALRIAVNDELHMVETVLPIAIHLLRPGGRLAVISFHSLEDRIVKQVFKAAAEEVVSPPGMQLAEKRAVVRLITRKPIEADEAEAARNPRSRSAKLRVVEKLGS